MQIDISEIGKLTLKENIDFLKFLWSNKEMTVFLEDVENLISNLKNGQFSQYQKYSCNINSALIGKKHVRVYFKKENENLIKILLFFDVRKDPNKLFDLLK